MDRIGLDWIGSTVTIVASTNIFIIVVIIIVFVSSTSSLSY